MQIVFIFILIIFLALFLGLQYLFCLSTVRIFAITSPLQKEIFFAVLFFLAVSFFLATLAAHFREGLITRTFYFLSGFWLGFFLNLLLATLASWLLIGLGFWLGYNFNPAWLGSLFFVWALVYSVYGVWNAFHPRVKNIDVTIKNLPAAWQGKKIVQLSDIHLGHIYQAGFLAKIVNMTNALHPDMVVITGDLFDGMDGRLANLIGPLDNLQAPDGTYFITGNHETYLGVEQTFALLQKTRVTILNDAVREIKGLQLVGISYPERNANKDVADTMQALPDFLPNRPTILLYHSPVQIDKIKAAGVNLQLSGHTHQGQLFPFEFITRLAYKGYDYGLHTAGDFSIYTTDGVGTWGPTMRTGNTPEIVNITLH